MMKAHFKLNKGLKNKLIALYLSMGGLVGCGAGLDPMTLFENPLPELDAIVAGTGINAGFTSQSQAYFPGHLYWEFNTGFGGFGLNQPFYAPANGIVSAVGVDAETGGNFVQIAHSGRLATKVVGVQLTTVRQGDSVAKGAAIGTYSPFSTFVRFQVLLDGTPVCPLSFMSQTFRTNMGGFSFNPCI